MGNLKFKLSQKIMKIIKQHQWWKRNTVSKIRLMVWLLILVSVLYILQKCKIINNVTIFIRDLKFWREKQRIKYKSYGKSRWSQNKNIHLRLIFLSRVEIINMFLVNKKMKAELYKNIYCKSNKNIVFSQKLISINPLDPLVLAHLDAVIYLLSILLHLESIITTHIIVLALLELDSIMNFRINDHEV